MQWNCSTRNLAKGPFHCTKLALSLYIEGAKSMLNAWLFLQDNDQDLSCVLPFFDWHLKRGVGISQRRCYKPDASAGDNNWWHLQKGRQKAVESRVCCLPLSDLLSFMELLPCFNIMIQHLALLNLALNFKRRGGINKHETKKWR